MVVRWPFSLVAVHRLRLGPEVPCTNAEKRSAICIVPRFFCSVYLLHANLRRTGYEVQVFTHITILRTVCIRSAYLLNFNFLFLALPCLKTLLYSGAALLPLPL